ncbi:thioredoxin 1-like [Lolium rigidum]|uniref:thioredoxin 1-like n=1 Tax=Lolium rigidum TaxID=89674 RepID=UPI001F5C1EB7|nr:thioredoxin 1-like [Lolium rigidum]
MPATAAISPSPPGASTTTLLLRHHHAATFTPPQPSRRRLTGAVAASAGRRAVAPCCKAAKDPSAASATGHVGDVGEQTWDEDVLRCETTVLVEFWAPWCGPCRLMHPIIADLAKAYAGRLRCLRVNTDENQEVATRYGIRSIPTTLIFKNGERKETVIGAIADTALAATVDRFL